MNQYEVTKVLGDGSFGSVLRARNRNSGELVAIKKMKQKYHSWEECMKLREINSLRKLVHPNIVKLKEVIRESDELHLVFEFCEGNLFEHMKAQQSKGKSLPESKVCSYTFQTLQAVQFVHKHGYFHRDLKPDNLLVSGEVVKLADFGLAREIRARPPFTEYVATRWYRAPEILLRSRCYNSPVDMWAVGAIMAELYAMRPLMPGTSEPDQLFRICSVLGTPTQAQWPEGHRLAGQLGLRFPQVAPTALEALLPQGSASGLCAAGQLLQWDPGRRPTACRILQHPFFEACAPEAPAARGAPAEAAAPAEGPPPAEAPTAPARRVPRLPLRSGSFGLQGRGARRAARGPGEPASARELGAAGGRRGSKDSQELRMGGSCAGFFRGTEPAGGSARAASQTASGGFDLPALQRTAQGAGSPRGGEDAGSSGAACLRMAPPPGGGSFSPTSTRLRVALWQPGVRQAVVPPAAVQSALSRWGR